MPSMYYICILHEVNEFKMTVIHLRCTHNHASASLHILDTTSQSGVPAVYWVMCC